MFTLEESKLLIRCIRYVKWTIILCLIVFFGKILLAKILSLY